MDERILYRCTQCGTTRIGAGRCEECETITTREGAWSDWEDEDREDTYEIWSV